MWLKYGPMNPRNILYTKNDVFDGQSKVTVREATCTWSVLTYKADYEPKTIKTTVFCHSAKLFATRYAR